MELGEDLLRLGAATLAGAALGWERESRSKPAGLRTHMLVSLGSALFLLASLRFMHDVERDHDVVLDPFRVLQGIVGGVGFLGAGAIIQSSRDVRGLTTASSIWLASGAGIACAFGYYVLAVVAVALGLVILAVIGRLESTAFNQDGPPPSDK
jgi:putative Mg2+ transporter-C (MgtC) family protein